MLANSHSTPSANSMFASCAGIRAAFRLDALTSTTSPTASSASTMPNSVPSMLRVREFPSRLTVGCIVVLAALFRRGQLAEEVVVEHLARERRGRARAEAGVFHDHGERDAGILRRCVRDEERMIAQLLLHPALHILLALLDADHLGGARLARAHVRAPRKGGRRGAFLVDADERLLDHREMLALQLERAQPPGLDKNT